jgi:hypothetical protein
MSCELPIPLIVNKQPDIMLINDASERLPDGSYEELKRVAVLFEGQGLPWLSEGISYPIQKTKNLIVFKSPNPKYPVIIYFHNLYAFGATTFQYTNQEFDLLHNEMRTSVKEAYPAIFEIVKERANNLD